jgi:hypothetical protein
MHGVRRLAENGAALRISGNRPSPLGWRTVQQRVEALSRHLDRYRGGRRLVVALVHQVIAILADFVDFIPDVLRDRPSLFDSSRPINEVSSPDQVVWVARDVSTLRTERCFKLGPHSDQIRRFDLFGCRNQIAGRRPRRQRGIARQGDGAVVGDSSAYYVSLPLRALDSVDECLTFSH